MDAGVPRVLVGTGAASSFGSEIGLSLSELDSRRRKLESPASPLVSIPS